MYSTVSRDPSMVFFSRTSKLIQALHKNHYLANRKLDPVNSPGLMGATYALFTRRVFDCELVGVFRLGNEVFYRIYGQVTFDCLLRTPGSELVRLV